MRKTVVKELGMGGFREYGSFVRMIDPDVAKFGAEPIEFFRDMLQVDLDGRTAASLSICRVCKRPLIISVAEHHSSCGEGILPLDGDVVIHVGPASRNGVVPVEDFEVFRVPKGTLVSLRPGVWHHAPFTLSGGPVNVLVILPERTYANDCVVYQIPEKDRIEIEGI